MGFTLASRKVTSISECVRKEMITYVEYDGPSPKRAITYPQYLVDEDKITRIDTTTFPEIGGLPVTLEGKTKEEYEGIFGRLVVMKTNVDVDQFMDNNYYPHLEHHRYNSIANYNWKPGRSNIDFVEFRKSQISSRLVQIISADDGLIDFSQPLVSTIHPSVSQAMPLTKYIMLRQEIDDQPYLYGPFEIEQKAPGVYSIKAVQSFDEYIFAEKASSFTFKLTVNDGEGNPYARLLDIDEIKTRFTSSNRKYDWMPNETVLSAIARVSRTTEVGLSKNEARNLKTAIEACTDLETKIVTTPERRKRMLTALSKYEEWSTLSDNRKREIIDTVSSEQLAQYVLDDEHFAEFYDKVKENEQIRQEVARRQADLEKQIQRAHEETAQAEQRARDAKAAADEAEASRDEVKKRIVAETEAELTGRRAELDKTLEDLRSAKADLENLEEGKVLAKRAIKNVVESFKDEMTASEKLLESTVVREILGAVNPVPSGTAPLANPQQANEVAPTLAMPAMLSDDKLSASDLLDRMSDTVINRAGRDFTRNDIANLMICLTQGYITTFAGMPGTGKTSLAGILAGALGLTQPQANRFCEVSVERGWTSYKDFIGFYNPFMERVEPANAAAYQAFEQLDAEQQLKDLTPTPYIMLLDEANLSSLEHYWSPFLLACDKFRNRPTALSLGGGHAFTTPSWLRFIATVNFDHTTEELSPRFLDRSWVIMLDAPDTPLDIDDIQSEEHDFSDEPAVPLSTIESAFGVRETQMPAGLAAKFQEVLTCCATSNHPVSPRSQLMMRNYIVTASNLMDTSSASTTYDPVDFAVAQKVLPQICGTEDRVRNLLDGLGAITGLPKTKQRIEHILEVGGDSGFYQFFA